MNAPATFTLPTELDRQLANIDLIFVTTKQAERILIARNEISADKPFGEALPTERGRKIAALAKQLRAEHNTLEGDNSRPAQTYSLMGNLA